MKTIKGDLLRLAMESQFDVIVHGCNCFCNMGAGIAKTISQNFPEAFAADQQTIVGEKNKLGNFSSAGINRKEVHFVIVNAYTQFECLGKAGHVEYDAIRAVFRKIKETFRGKRIGYPAIGAGLAGGNWGIISQIIEEELQGEDHTFVQFIPRAGSFNKQQKI